ncbi:hypothetical protein O1611_g1654 [Lasiodiplodia mahajangana]|uniref:Uncharacterized protein n=1 Tax=Lasiodiplodia mahajangana TaxID=1108764 RepID=A0ACC2JXE6_9PEZI|nr:hypothetical protein O1611_g1654 [Lasiodiplodia mahajangana]
MSASPSSSVGFAQQGQVDWVAFGDTFVHLTINILGRLEGAGVQALTYAGIELVVQQFQLPELGRQRILSVVQGLGVHNGVSNLLWFGFGHRSLFRHLSESVSGLKCIALCSCLGEVHSETTSAKVLCALWKELGFPEDFEPSHTQFVALIKACGGALATSPFPELLHRMLPGNMTGPTQQRSSDPADIARALHALFQISSGQKKSLALVGGAECSFVAAMAYWIFDFDVYVEDMDEQLVFRSSISGTTIQSASAQVYVRYMDLAEPKVIVSQTTYVLGNPKELLVYAPESELVLRRRVPWNRCLYNTFGQAFKDLSALPTDLGIILGGVAGIHAALTRGDVAVRDYNRPHFPYFAEASQGSAYLDFAEEIFPEIKRMGMRRIMQATLSKSVIEIESLLDASSLAMRRSCQCQDCCATPLKRYYCLQELANTIVNLITTLSSVRFEYGKKIDPTCYGLEWFFHRSKVTKYRPTPFLASDGTGKSTSPQTLERRLENLICLFTGCSPFGELSGSIRSGEWTAISKSGICVFAEALVSMTAQSDILCQIHVMPGRIGRPKSKNLSTAREFDAVLDLSLWPKLPPLSNLEVSMVAESPMGPKQVDKAFGALEMTPIVLEVGDGAMLTLYYCVSTPQGDIHIPPGRMTNLVLRQSGLISCDKVNCPTMPPRGNTVFSVKRGWKVDEAAVTTLP